MTISQIFQDIRKRMLEISTAVYSDEDLLIWLNQTKNEIVGEFLTNDRITKKTLTFTNGEADLPSDYQAFYHAFQDSLSNDFKLVSLTDFENKTLFSQMLTIEGNKLLVYPKETTSLTLRYYKKIPDITLGASLTGLNELFDECLILGVISRALEAGQDFETSNLYFVKYKEKLEKVKRNLKMLQENEIQKEYIKSVNLI